jgi:hypothetical protein
MRSPPLLMGLEHVQERRLVLAFDSFNLFVDNCVGKAIHAIAETVPDVSILAIYFAR